MNPPPVAAADGGATAEMSRGKMILMVAALVGAVISFQLNASMLVPAIGEITEALGENAYTAMGNYFFLSGAIVSVIFVRWSDFVGRKNVLIGIMIVTVIGTVVCVFATSLPLMVIGRILQGGSVISFGLAYLIFKEHLHGSAFGACVGIVSAINGGVAGVDSLLGGVMADHLGYRSIFVLILVVGVLSILFAVYAVPGRRPGSGDVGRMDWTGGVLMGVVAAGINLFLTQGGTHGWLSGPALLWVAVSVAAFVIFLVVESRLQNPLIAVNHLRSRMCWPVVTSVTLALSAFYVVLNFIVPSIAENSEVGFALSGTAMALIFLTPAALIGLGTAPFAGRLAVRTSFVFTLRAGLVATLIVTAATAIFALDKWAVFALMIVLGITYNGLMLTSASGMGVVQAPDEAPGSLPGISNACFGIGASIGFAWAGPIVGPGTADGYHTGLWVCVVIGLFALASSFILRPKPVRAEAAEVAA
ncbi:MAG: MFS transporter [Gordonia sp. (in: high G+C Gram-positive bacteria)]